MHVSIPPADTISLRSKIAAAVASHPFHETGTTEPVSTCNKRRCMLRLAGAYRITTGIDTQISRPIVHRLSGGGRDALYDLRPTREGFRARYPRGQLLKKGGAPPRAQGAPGRPLDRMAAAAHSPGTVAPPARWICSAARPCGSTTDCLRYRCAGCCCVTGKASSSRILWSPMGRS